MILCLNFRRFIYFLSGFCFRSEFYSRDDISSPTFPCARDLVTMAEVGSARPTSLERVTTGVGSVSRTAMAKPNSIGRSMRPILRVESVSVTFPEDILKLSLSLLETNGTDYRSKRMKYKFWQAKCNTSPTFRTWEN